MRARSNELTVKSCMPQRNWDGWGVVWGEGDAQRADADEEKGGRLFFFFFRIAKFLEAAWTFQLG